MHDIVFNTPLWCAPFVILLCAIAIAPAVVGHHTWEAIAHRVVVFCIIILLIPLVSYYGFLHSIYMIEHVLIDEYIPFVLLLGALYYSASGIYVSSHLVTGKPVSNAIYLILAGLSSSILGTTGSSIVFIRTFLEANAFRKHRMHHVIFFIIVVSNLGGALTPLGDPPLFLGYLNGIDFFWVTKNLFKETAVILIITISIFFAIDVYVYCYYEKHAPPSTRQKGFHISGYMNIVLILCVIAILLTSSLIEYEIHSKIYREFMMFAVCICAYLLNKSRGTAVDHTPYKEVLVIFLGIFLTAMPVMEILKSGMYNAYFPFNILYDANMMPKPFEFFWVTGILSSALDNSPTYLMFFNMASGGDISFFKTSAGTNTLIAISAAAVYMGCLTYIGNAPNLIVKSIAETRFKIIMPSMITYFMLVLFVMMPGFIFISYML